MNILYFPGLTETECEIWIGDEESHADIGNVTKAAIFVNSR